MANLGKQWLRMGTKDIERLGRLGLAVSGRDVEVDVEEEELDNGFRTVAFRAGKHHVEAVLDARYESAGDYQFTNESRQRLGIRLECSKAVDELLPLAKEVVEAVCFAEAHGGLPSNVATELASYRRSGAETDEGRLAVAEAVVNAAMEAEDCGWRPGRVAKTLAAYRTAVGD